MAINFKSMRSEDDFEEMCRQLILAEHSVAVPVEANPGDESMDAFEGVIDEEIEHIWQFKHFPHRIGKTQQDQIRRSLKGAVQRHEPKMWTLLTSSDLSPDNRRWLKRQKRDFPEVEIDVLSATQIRQMLTRHQDIRKQYFPLLDEKTDALMRMVAKEDREGLPKARILQTVLDDVAVLNDNSPHFKYAFSVDETGVRISAKPRTEEARQKPIAEMTLAFPEDDADARAALEKYIGDVNAGRPTVVPGRYVTVTESVFDQFIGEDYRISEVRVAPSIPDIRVPTRLHVSHEGEEASVLYVDLRLIRRGRRELEFSNAAQTDLPFKVCVTFRDTPPATLAVSLTNVSGMKPSGVIEFERVMSIMGRAGSVATLESLKTNRSITSEIELASDELPPGRLRLFEDLLLIERELDPDLTLQEEMSEADFEAILGIARALRTGKATKHGTAKVVVIPHDPQQLRELVETCEPLTWVTKDGVETFTLFGRLYEFGFETIMTGPATILEEAHPDGGIRVAVVGEIHFSYGKGRYVGLAPNIG